MSNIVDTVEDRVQNAILIAIDSIVAPEIELAFRSLNVSSGQDPTGVTANTERGEHVRINVFFENASGTKKKLHVTILNDESRKNIPDGICGFAVLDTYFDRQTHSSLGDRTNNPNKSNP